MNLTIAIPADQEQRILDALQHSMMLPDETTVTKAHFKVWVIQQIKEMVRHAERQVKAQEAENAHVEPDLT